MKIIVDSGATKAGWTSLGPDGAVCVYTAGLNLSTADATSVRRIVRDAAEKLGRPENVSGIYFYGAGIIAAPAALDAALSEAFPGARVEYASDLLGAARAVFGRRPGIACILGTGSNSCFYDGENVVRNLHPCGFILGDEGGGASLGKRFVADYLKEMLPAEVARDFGKKFEVDYMTVVRNVYKGEAPARYLASFAPYVLSWYGKDEAVSRIVEDNFRDFIRKFLLRYDIAGNEVGVVGGFAVAAETVLRKVAEQEGVRIGKVMADPMPGLIDFYGID